MAESVSASLAPFQSEERLFRRRALAGLLCGSLLALAGFGTGTLFALRSRARATDALHADALATCLSVAADLSMANAQASAPGATTSSSRLQRLRSDDRLRFAAIVDSSGRVRESVLHSGVAAARDLSTLSAEAGDAASASLPIAGGSDVVHVALSLEPVSRALRDDLQSGALLSIVLLGIGLVVGFAIVAPPSTLEATDGALRRSSLDAFVGGGIDAVDEGEALA